MKMAPLRTSGLGPALTRRRFLVAGGTALGALASGCVGGAASDDPLYGMHLDVRTAELGHAARFAVSTEVASTELTIHAALTGAELDRLVVNGAAQANPGDGWLGSGFERHLMLPLLPAGLYTVQVPESVIPFAERKLSFRHTTWQAPLAVRDPLVSQPVLVVFDGHTDQAYNQWGGASYYSDPHSVTVGPARPGYDAKNFESAVNAVKLAGQVGFGCDVVDSFYAEDHPDLFEDYTLVIVTGQLEYVSRPLRDMLEAHYAAGGRLLLVSAETLAIQSRREGPLLTTYKFPSRGPDPIEFDPDPVVAATASYEWVRSDPETRFLGTTFWLGGNPGVETPWTAWRTGHWLWSGTGLADGDPFGAVQQQQFTDGTFLTFQGGLPVPAQTQLTETPDDFLILGTVPTIRARPFWLWLASGQPKSDYDQPGWGTIGIRGNAAGGVLLNVPDIRLLRHRWSGDATVQQFLRNAIGTLADSAPVDAYDGY